MDERLLELLLTLNPSRLEEEYRAREVASRETVEAPAAVRLDGVGWGRRLRGRFEWPRDERVHRALARSALEALQLLQADLAYVVSDEASIVWLRGLPYSGRIEKLDSIAAAATASRVSLRLGLPLELDARVVKLYSSRDAARYILYRARVGFNNYVSSLYHSLPGADPRETPPLGEMLKTLEEHGLNPLEPPWKSLGSCVVRLPSRRLVLPDGVEAGRRRLAILDGPWACLEYLEGEHVEQEALH